MTKIILASSSPRRKELLKKIVGDFEIIPSEVDEVYPSSILPIDVSLYLSNLKAKDVASKHKDSIVIGCDTTVIINDMILGKPKNYNDAKNMLELLSNNMHIVASAVTIFYKEKIYQINSINKVFFKKLTTLEIEEYLKNDEYKDKAGAYAIQGIANKFILKYDGEYESIVGLPIKELNDILKEIM